MVLIEKLVINTPTYALTCTMLDLAVAGYEYVRIRHAIEDQVSDLIWAVSRSIKYGTKT